MGKDEELDSRKKDIEQLETLAFYFTQLNKRLSQDREHWAETGKDLNKSVDRLDQTIQALEGFETKLKEQVTVVLQQESQKAAQMIAQACRETTQQVLTEQIKETAEHLSEVVHQVSNTLTDYQSEVKSLKQWFLIGILLSALVGNILAGVAVYFLLL